MPSLYCSEVLNKTEQTPIARFRATDSRRIVNIRKAESVPNGRTVNKGW